MGGVANLTVEILGQIRDEVRGTNKRLDGLTTRVDRLETRLGNLENQMAETNSRLRMVEAAILQANSRLDRLIELSGKSWRDLERRVRKIEKHGGLS